MGVWEQWRIKRTYKTARKVSDGREIAAKVRLSIRNNVMLCVFRACTVCQFNSDDRGWRHTRKKPSPSECSALMMGSSTVRGRSSAFSAVEPSTKTSNASCGRGAQVSQRRDTHARARARRLRTGDAQTAVRMCDVRVARHIFRGLYQTSESAMSRFSVVDDMPRDRNSRTAAHAGGPRARTPWWPLAQRS